MYAWVQYNWGTWQKAKTPIPRKYNIVLMGVLVETIKHTMVWRKCGLNDHKNQVSLYHITVNQLVGHKTESSKSVRTSAGTFKFISYCPSLDIFSGPRRACCLMKFVTMPGWTDDIVNRHPQVTRAKGWKKKKSKKNLSCRNIYFFSHRVHSMEEGGSNIWNKNKCKIRLETYKTANVISVARKLSEIQILLCLKQNENMISFKRNEVS